MRCGNKFTWTHVSGSVLGRMEYAIRLVHCHRRRLCLGVNIVLCHFQPYICVDCWLLSFFGRCTRMLVFQYYLRTSGVRSLQFTVAFLRWMCVGSSVMFSPRNFWVSLTRYRGCHSLISFRIWVTFWLKVSTGIVRGEGHVLLLSFAPWYGQIFCPLINCQEYCKQRTVSF